MIISLYVFLSLVFLFLLSLSSARGSSLKNILLFIFFLIRHSLFFLEVFFVCTFFCAWLYQTSEFISDKRIKKLEYWRIFFLAWRKVGNEMKKVEFFLLLGCKVLRYRKICGLINVLTKKVFGINYLTRKCSDLFVLEWPLSLSG